MKPIAKALSDGAKAKIEEQRAKITFTDLHRKKQDAVNAVIHALHGLEDEDRLRVIDIVANFYCIKHRD